ncbi:MAG: CAP domain-containing protein [Pseudomonadota bacterium]
MRRMKLTFVLAASFAMLASPAAFGQSLDGMWLKLKVSANGIKVDNSDDSVRKKGTFLATCYMLVEYDAPTDTYASDTACKDGSNVWSEMPDGPSFTRFSDEGGYAFNENAGYSNKKGHEIEGAGTHLLTPGYDGKGRVVKAKLRSYGELNGSSSLKPGVTHFVGGYKVEGWSLRRKDVPSGVVALLEDNVGAAPPSSGVANEILALVNAERTSGGKCGGSSRPAVQPLSLDPSLSAAALVHAVDMASNDFFSHTGSDKSSPSQRIAAAGFSGRPEGENIAAGYPNPASVVAGWMNSTGHCNNIMDRDTEFLGVDYAFDPTSTYRHYWVQTFGSS